MLASMIFLRLKTSLNSALSRVKDCSIVRNKFIIWPTGVSWLGQKFGKDRKKLRRGLETNSENFAPEKIGKIGAKAEKIKSLSRSFDRPIFFSYRYCFGN